MAYRQRFSPEQEAANEKWHELTTKTYTDGQLEVIHERYVKKHNLLRTSRDREAFMIDVGAARRDRRQGVLVYAMDKENPGHLLLERVENALKQWQDWYHRHWPQERVSAYEDLAARRPQKRVEDSLSTGTHAQP